MSPLEVRLSCLPTAKVGISIENGNFTFAACRKRIGSLGFIPASWVMYFQKFKVLAIFKASFPDFFYVARKNNFNNIITPLKSTI